MSQASPSGLHIRPATAADMDAVRGIYAHYVQHTRFTYEEVAPDHGEISRRWRATVDGGYPYLVADLDGEVAGYAYAGPFRLRDAYRFTVENSVYIRPLAVRRGVGSALMTRLIDACESCGFRQMIAVIGDDANHGSVMLHRKCGFTLIGVMPASGYKHGRWVDTTIMQRPLGPGGDTPPD